MIAGFPLLKVTVLLLIFAATAFSQEPAKSLYARGLEGCLTKALAGRGAGSEKRPDSVVVSYNLDLINELSAQLNDLKVEFLSDEDLAERFKRLPKSEQKRGIQVIKIFPIKDKGNKLFFALNNYWFSYDEKGGVISQKQLIYNWALEGGCRAEIGFDARERKFIIQNVELWGV